MAAPMRRVTVVAWDAPTEGNKDSPDREITGSRAEHSPGTDSYYKQRNRQIRK